MNKNFQMLHFEFAFLWLACLRVEQDKNLECDLRKDHAFIIKLHTASLYSLLRLSLSHSHG